MRFFLLVVTLVSLHTPCMGMFTKATRFMHPSAQCLRFASKFVNKKEKLNNWMREKGFSHVNAIRLVIKPAGYDYGDQEWRYYTFPLSAALNEYDQDPEIIQLLLEEGANVNFQTIESLGPALFSLLVNSNVWKPTTTLPILKLLIEYGADVNVRDKHDKSTPLHQAAYSWTSSIAKEIITILLCEGAKLDARDAKGRTPYDVVWESLQWPNYRDYDCPTEILELLKLNKRTKNTGPRMDE